MLVVGHCQDIAVYISTDKLFSVLFMIENKLKRASVIGAFLTKCLGKTTLKHSSKKSHYAFKNPIIFNNMHFFIPYFQNEKMLSRDIDHIFSVPFDEDAHDKSVWFLDHDYMEQMYTMFKKVNGKSNIHSQLNFDYDILCLYNISYIQIKMYLIIILSLSNWDFFFNN